MRFREINVVTTVGAVLSAGLGIGLAVAGLGYWALIVPVAGGLAWQAVGSFFYARYRPRHGFDAAAFRRVRTFGVVILLGGILRYASDNADYAIMGKYWSEAVRGADLLGLYYFAFEWAQRPFLLVMAQLRSVMFPALSSLQRDASALKDMFLKATHTVSLLLLPLHVFMIGLADPVVPWVFGSQWTAAVPVFQAFAAFGFIRTVASFVPSGLLAVDRPEVSLYFSIFRIAVVLPALFLLGSGGAGIMTTAMVLVAIWYLQTPVYLVMALRILDIRMRDLRAWLRVPLTASAACGGLLALIRVLLGGRVAQPVEVAAAAVLPMLLFLLLSREDLRRTLETVRRGLLS
jgi:O-antigen/teichoic acid export membrane protein